MNSKQFAEAFKKAAEHDPLRELAKELYNSGITEDKLQEFLTSRDCALFPLPIRMKLEERFRDIVLANRIKFGKVAQ